MRHSSHPHYAHGTKNETFLLWATFSYLCTDWIGRMNLKICSSSRRVTVLKVFQLEILWKTRWADFCEQITKTEQISNIAAVPMCEKGSREEMERTCYYDVKTKNAWNFGEMRKSSDRVNVPSMHAYTLKILGALNAGIMCWIDGGQSFYTISLFYRSTGYFGP